ncbi:MAG: selenium-binding protein [Pirellulaceae bacterium]|nr:MAG: selenium-binding protein [Pirellulaceae bacterium]GIW95332.1 MAG: selenium-binding protein [Pirellulaceae bacterium]
MDRRRFMQIAFGTAVAHAAAPLLGQTAPTPGYASPAQAMQAPPEELLFVTCTYAHTGVEKPDYLAVIDCRPGSPTYSQVIHRLEMPHVGDELHHYGWNICSSCHGRPGDRRYLVVPGLYSSRIHIVDAADPRHLQLVKCIEPEEIFRAVDLSAPHTVHCLPTGQIMISMLGDSRGQGPGGFLLLDEQFNIAGRWEKSTEPMRFNYDFWYQPRANAMVSSEWAAPQTFAPGPRLEDVAAGKYGRRIHLWDWKERRIRQSFDLGDGAIPLEVRFAHDPQRSYGYVGAALSSALWYFGTDAQGQWQARKVVQLAARADERFPGKSVPALISDFVISMDDRFLYLSAWLEGTIYQYDVSNPLAPRLASRLELGGWGRESRTLRGKKLNGGPQMLQLSLDGKRLYATNSLYSTWDNLFYPDIARQGSWLIAIDCDTQQGGMKLREDFLVDFGNEPHGPARAHEIRYPGGDVTSDIFS